MWNVSLELGNIANAVEAVNSWFLRKKFLDKAMSLSDCYSGTNLAEAYD